MTKLSKNANIFKVYFFIILRYIGPFDSHLCIKDKPLKNFQRL